LQYGGAAVLVVESHDVNISEPGSTIFISQFAPAG
jgi:hypothetical protein